MRSRRSSPGRLLGGTKVCPVDESLAKHLWLTWKESQTGPRCRPQPFSRVLTAWKGRSRTYALRVGLLLDHRLWRPRSDYGVCVPMHYLPGAIFRSKDHRSPHSVCSGVLPFAYHGCYLCDPNHSYRLKQGDMT
jgi:hypothetical protein